MEPSDALTADARQTRSLAARVYACNALSARFGLTLTEAEARALAARRNAALAETGRVELSGSVLPALIAAFCDSPYLLRDEYAETLEALTDAFYYFKNETRDLLADDELLAVMRTCFDENGGSADAVLGLSVEELCGCRRLEDTDALDE